MERKYWQGIWLARGLKQLMIWASDLSILKYCWSLYRSNQFCCNNDSTRESEPIQLWWSIIILIVRKHQPSKLIIDLFERKTDTVSTVHELSSATTAVYSPPVMTETTWHLGDREIKYDGEGHCSHTQTALLYLQQKQILRAVIKELHKYCDPGEY